MLIHFGSVKAHFLTKWALQAAPWMIGYAWGLNMAIFEIL